jgi:hypothetical protein
MGTHSPSPPKIDLNDVGSEFFLQEDKWKHDLYLLEDALFFLRYFVLEAVFGDEFSPMVVDQVCYHIPLGFSAEASVALTPQITRHLNQVKSPLVIQFFGLLALHTIAVGITLYHLHSIAIFIQAQRT